MLSLPPVHSIETNLTQPAAALLALLAGQIFRIRVAALSAGAGVTGRLGGGGGRVDVFAIDVLGFGHKRAATVAPTRVPLFDAEELEFGVDEVDEIHD